MTLKSVVILLLFIFAQFIKSDDYVEEIHQKCNTTELSYDCEKYRLLKNLEDFDFEWNTDGIVSLIKIPPQEAAISLPKYRSDDAEYVKFFKFLRRKAISFLDTHTLAFQLPKQLDGIQGRSSDASEVTESKAAEFLKAALEFQVQSDELDKCFTPNSDISCSPKSSGRGRSFIDKKKMKIISKIILFKLLKIKFMLSGVLFVILSVKTVLIVAALIYPWIYQGLITSCEKVNQGWWGWG